MRSCHDHDSREMLVRRLRRLPPDAQPRWGRMTPASMLAHLRDALHIAYGEQDPGRYDGPRFLKSAVGRWLVIDSPLPWPKGKLEAPPEWHATEPGDFQEDRELLIGELDRFPETRESWGVSPAFGALSPAQWGRLTWRHIDHHLRQFGC